MTKVTFIAEDATEYRRYVVNMLIHNIAQHDGDGVNETTQLYRYLLKERRRLQNGAIVGE